MDKSKAAKHGALKALMGVMDEDEGAMLKARKAAPPAVHVHVHVPGGGDVEPDEPAPAGGDADLEKLRALKRK